MVEQNKAVARQSYKVLRQTWWVQLVVGGGILAAGILAAVLLIKAKQRPQTKEPINPGPLVNTIAAKAGQVRMTVQGYGTVAARVQVAVVPQVSGKVVSVHEALESGGYIPAGEALVQIDRADYELALDQAQAQLAAAQAAQAQATAAIEQAKTQLAVEQAEAAVAKSEWQASHPGEAAAPLVLREPQIRQARAAVAAAEAQRASAAAGVRQAKALVATAQLNLARTTVSLPYAARVLRESVDVGQFITAGQVIAELYGVSKAEITVMLDQRDLAWFEVPATGEECGGGGSAAEVSAAFAGKRWTWAGRVVRLGGAVDEQSRLVPVVVEVDQPFDVTGGRPGLLPGTFARVEIAGRQMADVVTIPRYAVHDDQEVWVVREGTLRIVKPRIIRQTVERAYITEGLAPGEAVIITLLDAITDGMKVRTEKLDARNSNDE